MLLEKTNISARVDITLKKIVEDSTFTHKDAYELGAKLMLVFSNNIIHIFIMFYI